MIKPLANTVHRGPIQFWQGLHAHFGIGFFPRLTKSQEKYHSNCFSIILKSQHIV